VPPTTPGASVSTSRGPARKVDQGAVLTLQPSRDLRRVTEFGARLPEPLPADATNLAGGS
jgi:hypothetical protein